MNFDFSDEQRAIRDTARDLLASRDDSADVWGELCDLGFAGIAVAEEHGGQGLGTIELALLVEQLGYACAPTPFLGTCLAALAIQEGGSAEQQARWLPSLATGEALGALASLEVPSLIPDAGADGLLVVADPRDGTATILPPGASTDVEAIDPGRRHGKLEVAEGGEPLPGGLGAALDRAVVVVAAELVGLCRRALELTVDYVKERRQFGRPVGSFQAVQHVAAQMLRDTEAASVATSFAAWAADADPAALPLAAATAKALASEAGRTVTASAIQLHGGIGFTWEADVHWLFKRAQVDAVYLGGAGHHRARIVRTLSATT